MYINFNLKLCIRPFVAADKFTIRTNCIKHICNGAIFTVLNSSCGKVMFLHLSVILFTGGESRTPGQTHPCLPGRHPLPLGRHPLPLGRHPQGRHPPKQIPIPWADTPRQTPPADCPPGQTPPPFRHCHCSGQYA